MKKADQAFISTDVVNLLHLALFVPGTDQVLLFSMRSDGSTPARSCRALITPYVGNKRLSLDEPKSRPVITGGTLTFDARCCL